MDLDPPDGEVETDSEHPVLYLETFLLFFFLIAGILANAPVLILYLRSKHIRSITDKFLLNLLLADLLSLILLFPCLLATVFQQEKASEQSVQFPLYVATGTGHFGPIPNILNHTTETSSAGASEWDWRCRLSNGILAGIAAASVLAALEIAMERYLAVVKPLHYHKFLTTPSILTTSLVGGVISSVTGIVSSMEPTLSLFPHCPSSSPDLMSSKGDLMWALYTLTSTLLLFLLPVILMLYIYSKIWLEARRQKIKISKQYKPYFVPIPKENPEPVTPGKVRGAAFLPIIVKFRLMQRLRAGRVDRAGRVAIVALAVTLLCWSAYYGIRGYSALRTVLHAYGYSYEGSLSLTGSHWTTSHLPLLLASLHPLLSPLFYAYRYKRMRTEIGKAISALCQFQPSRMDGCKSRASTAHTSISGPHCTRQVIITQPTEEPVRIIPLVNPGYVEGEQVLVSPQAPSTGKSEGGQNSQANPHICINVFSADGNCVCVSDPEEEIEVVSGPERGPEPGGIVRMERSMGNFFNYLNVWVSSYSRRYLTHRESVTSTASIITLLSNKYHNKTHTVANV